MTVDPVTYALIARLHGISAALGLAILLHPVLNLRSRRARSWWTRFTVELSAVLMAVPFTVGWFLYPIYRVEVKVPLRVVDPGTVLRFESKEHLAAMAIALIVGGALILRFGGESPTTRRASWTLLTCGWVLGVVTALLGVWVGGHAHPGW